MMDAADLRSGKTHRDENFPVASWLVAKPYREPILAFYEFVRIADDVADHATLASADKLRLLDEMEATLDGRSTQHASGVRLRRVLAERGLSDRHARDLLQAFRQDAYIKRYESWDELMAYCALSAMPVGRHVLSVHGESAATFAPSDAICAALQIINHLQDCGKDRRALDRVYIPRDALAAEGLDVDVLDAAEASPALRRCLSGLARRTGLLLDEGAPLPGLIGDLRLSLEIGVIHSLARRLVRLLETGDPLAGGVHLGKGAMLAIALRSVGAGLLSRVVHQGQPAPRKADAA